MGRQPAHQPDMQNYVSSQIPTSLALHRDRPIAWAGNRIKIRASTERVSPLFAEEGLPPSEIPVVVDQLE